MSARDGDDRSGDGRSGDGGVVVIVKSFGLWPTSGDDDAEKGSWVAEGLILMERGGFRATGGGGAGSRVSNSSNRCGG